MRRRTDLFIASLLILICCLYVYGILQIEDRILSSNEIGPALFPWMLSIALFVLSVVLVVRECIILFNETAPAAWERNRPAIRSIVLAVLLMLTFVLIIPFTGLFWIMPLFIVAFSVLYGFRRLFLISGIAVVLTFGLYLLLWRVFGVLLL